MKQLLLLMCSVALMFATGCKNDETNPTPPPATTGSDLSAAGCANSYLVHGAGAYSFDATVMGNGVSTEPFAATKLSPSSAALLWQDAPALLSDVRLEEGRVHFTAGEGQGNALIAVRDADGRILWSWHIWVTDYDPSSQAPKLNGLSWMTRNLGALSDDYDETGSAKGFVYQWGRKDPFPSGAGWNDLNDITVYDASGTAATDLFANEQVTASNNLQNAVEHPTTFYYGTRIGDDYYDWLTADGTAKNNRLWETAADGGKTLFDPCPPGWRVPRNGSWKGGQRGQLHLRRGRLRTPPRTAGLLPRRRQPRRRIGHLELRGRTGLLLDLDRHAGAVLLHPQLPGRLPQSAEQLEPCGRMFGALRERDAGRARPRTLDG